MSAKRSNNFYQYRAYVRVFFIFSLLGLDFLTEATTGKEFEFESEYVVLASMLIVGPFFCGWACPFGNISYYVSKLGRYLLPKWQKKLPPKWDQRGRYLKYVLLMAFAFVFATTGHSYFGDHGEMYASTNFTIGYFVIKVVAVLFLSLFLGRFYCKYLCYQKAAYNLLNQTGAAAIVRDKEACVHCSTCDKRCPMDIAISEREKISGSECLFCFDCVAENPCPQQIEALKLNFLGQKVSVAKFAQVTVVLYCLFTALALWKLPTG